MSVNVLVIEMGRTNVSKIEKVMTNVPVMETARTNCAVLSWEAEEYSRDHGFSQNTELYTMFK